MNSGISRTDVAGGILTGTQNRNKLVDFIDMQLLHRHAGSAALLSWVPKLQSGSTDGQLMAHVAASQQFVDNAPASASAGSSLTGDSAFICALYEGFLGRKPDGASMQFSVDSLTFGGGGGGGGGGGAARAAVAQVMEQSPDAADHFATVADRKPWAGRRRPPSWVSRPRTCRAAPQTRPSSRRSPVRASSSPT